MNRGIYILPIGKIREEILEEVRKELANVFMLPVNLLSEISNPAYAFDPARGQYHSTKILREVVNYLPPDGLKILGITDVDLCTPVLTFVFGEAQLGGKACVISLTRLRQEYYALPSKDTLLLNRVVKEAIHELGHTLGLIHCSFPKCVMAFAPDVLSIDQKLPQFCSSCREVLNKMIKILEGKR